jgi:hypothetical protein
LRSLELETSPLHVSLQLVSDVPPFLQEMKQVWAQGTVQFCVANARPDVLGTIQGQIGKVNAALLQVEEGYAPGGAVTVGLMRQMEHEHRWSVQDAQARRWALKISSTSPAPAGGCSPGFRSAPRPSPFQGVLQVAQGAFLPQQQFQRQLQIA